MAGPYTYIKGVPADPFRLRVWFEVTTSPTFYIYTYTNYRATTTTTTTILLLLSYYYYYYYYNILLFLLLYTLYYLLIYIYMFRDMADNIHVRLFYIEILLFQTTKICVHGVGVLWVTRRYRRATRARV